MRRSIRFSIRDELKSRWAPNHIATARMKGWPRLLLDMRAFWRMGVETVLETRFHEPVKMLDHNEETKSL